MNNIWIFFFMFWTVNTMANPMVTIKNNIFYRNDQPYFFYGTNFWQAANLAAPKSGNLELLKKELDKLLEIGVTNIRVMVISEGPDTEPYRVVPALQKEPGSYNLDLLIGLDHLLVELNIRKMTAVFVLGNFWPWSGGFAQWVSWFEKSSIPYPPPHPGGSWSTFQTYASQFYANEMIQKAWRETVKLIVNRTNSLNGKKYIDDPAIFSWELANEPRGDKVRKHFLNWIKVSSDFIRTLDPHHLITVGSEGETADPTSAGNDFYVDHDFKNIDYTTLHLWVENWGLYNPQSPKDSLKTSIKFMKKYIDQHIQIAKKLKKPVVLEEFGISRDQLSYDPNSSTQIRDTYYSAVFEHTFDYMKNFELAGVNFWAWSGSARPVKPYGSIWGVGQPLLGDPPHEHQGWYGVYDHDISTLNIIKKFNAKIGDLENKE